MYISPTSLQEVCVNYICGNILELCDPLDFNEESLSKSDSSSSSSLSEIVSPNKRDVKLSFRDNDVYLHSEVSERLLSALCSKGRLTDQTFALFSPATTCLRKVSISNATNLSKEGFKVLKGHKVSELEACGLKFSVNDLVTCLGEWTLHNLRTLNVAKSVFSGSSRHCVMIALSKLKNLRSLDVSGTEFNRHALEIVVEDLPMLDSIDISSTRVDDISPLLKCRNRLKHLAMYNLKYIKVSASDAVLEELDSLVSLDISEEQDAFTYEIFAPTPPGLLSFLKSPYCLPNLISLDISGKRDINFSDLQTFLANHKCLSFLGLVHSDVCSHDCFTNSSDPNFNPNLKVTGIANENQILLSLKKYCSRTHYVQKCLYNLFRLTPSFTDARVDVIKLVLDGMAEHLGAFAVQMAATACLYNLTKGELASKLHPSILERVVNLCLVAMEQYPNHYQLQKNALLTLCSDRILQDVPIDRYRTAKLVLDSLCAFEDVSMNRMSVAIASILAAKISTSETSLLGSKPHYMKKLLRLVKEKMENNSLDVTLKFTLSALWNLTDESPTTCDVFLELDGLQLFLEVLKTFSGESSVETKVLGLINNIAEVPNLRRNLLYCDFISILRDLLHSSQIDVSYFAAGIMAHLATEGDKAWESCDWSRRAVLRELGHAVRCWDPPDGEMVAYRSFYPFISLLSCGDAPEVQLWAVWAIHHVSKKNPQRYCPMLQAEEGSEILKKMSENESLDEKVREIASDIKNLLMIYGGENRQ